MPNQSCEAHEKACPLCKNPPNMEPSAKQRSRVHWTIVVEKGRGNGCFADEGSSNSWDLQYFLTDSVSPWSIWPLTHWTLGLAPEPPVPRPCPATAGPAPALGALAAPVLAASATPAAQNPSAGKGRPRKTGITKPAQKRSRGWRGKQQ
ncbi:MAG: hypothetical protein FRX49_03788 [Trebouxia sp. A1-2]|nr:MAG: hypothetical protein FRX49_03788 [Trebouxia sp. A1-2]